MISIVEMKNLVSTLLLQMCFKILILSDDTFESTMNRCYTCIDLKIRTQDIVASPTKPHYKVVSGLIWV